MCKCVDIFGGWWRNSFIWFLFPLYIFFLVWAIFSSSSFLTCLGGMWYTFFEYVSFFWYALWACGIPDGDIPTVHDTSNVKNSPSNIKDTNQGALTRRRAKKLQEHINSFLTNYAFMTFKDVILPKCSTLVVLRCTHEERAPDRTQKSTRSDRTTSSDHQKKQL